MMQLYFENMTIIIFKTIKTQNSQASDWMFVFHQASLFTDYRIKFKVICRLFKD